MRATRPGIEEGQLHSGFVPVTLVGGPRVGDWVDLRQYRGLNIVLLKGIGTAGQDPVLTLEQATSAAGAGAKALPVSTYFKKEGATAVDAIAAFTQRTATTPGTIGGGDELTSAENEALWVVPVKDTDLDGANGFTHVRGSVAATANAQLATLLYETYGARRVSLPAPSVIG